MATVVLEARVFFDMVLKIHMVCLGRVGYLDLSVPAQSILVLITNQISSSRLHTGRVRELGRRA